MSLKRLKRLHYETIAPREQWSPSEWAEKAPRIIPDNGINPEPGPMSFDRTPYLREIADTLVAPGTEIVVFLKPTQVGYTTLVEMMPGYWADLDPGACMIVEPDEVSAKAMLTKRVLPTIQATPALKRHLSDRPWDKKRDLIQLDTMPIFAAWAGSPMRVAMWAIRYMLFDEVDKYPRFSGDEGDPIMLGLKRISNWLHRGRAMIGSTPTIREGNIWRWWEQCGDQRHYWVPCPDCGHYQQLIWSQVKWPKVTEGEDRRDAAGRIERDDLAYYECEACEYHIRDQHKHTMLNAGLWASQDQAVQHGGKVVGPRTESKRIGFHLNAMYSPWCSFSTLAAEYLLSIGDPARMMDFRNSRLAEPFEQQSAKMDADLVQRKMQQAEANQWLPGLVPTWVAMATLAVDTQKDHFWATVRCWGHGFRSRLILFERLESFADIEALLRTPLPVAGGGTMPIRMCLIDSGGTRDTDTGASRTSEVYQFSLKNPVQILPTKGASHHQINPIVRKQVTPKLPDGMGRMPPIQLALIATEWYKDILAVRMADAEQGWELTSEAGKYEYGRQMTAEHKIFDRKRNEYRWVPVSLGEPNHAWDCEVLQCVAADLCNVNLIPKDYRFIMPSSPAVEVEPSRSGKSRNWANSYKGKY